MLEAMGGRISIIDVGLVFGLAAVPLCLSRPTLTTPAPASPTALALSVGGSIGTRTYVLGTTPGLGTPRGR